MTGVSVSALFLTWFLLAGAAIGSFLNVVIFRLPRGFRVNLPSRSACRSCHRKLTWYENVPVLSYLLLGGRCLGCKSRVSFRYPMVELMTTTLFVAVYLKSGIGFSTLYYCAFCAALIAITFIDLDFRIIPDAISLPFVAVGLLGSFLVPELGLQASLLGAISGGLGFWALAAAYERATGREGLGLGDVKLLAMIGAFLGPAGAVVTVIVSSVVGSVFGLTIMVAQRASLKLALPYGPFLAIGALVYFFWGDVLTFALYPQ